MSLQVAKDVRFGKKAICRPAEVTCGRGFLPRSQPGGFSSMRNGQVQTGYVDLRYELEVNKWKYCHQRLD